MSERSTRRDFVSKTVPGASLGLAAGPLLFAQPAANGKPALLGGQPVRKEAFPSWPVVEKNDEANWSEVLHSKKWCRLDGNQVTRFEESWAKALGARHCLATASGTTALLTSLNALDIAPGDEV